MEIFREVNLIFQRSFLLVKYNLVLTLPFLFFWLLLGFVLQPLAVTGAGQGILFTLLLVLGLIAAFLSGWLNMFKKSVESPVDKNLSDDKHTEDSFSLFREFFPGVGKYFWKIALGLVSLFIMFNILMLIIEIIIIPLFGAFESFSQEDLVKAMNNPEGISRFWAEISENDRLRIFKIAGVEALFTILYLYVTMFWSQLVVLNEDSPFSSFKKSFKVIMKDPQRTSLVFFLNFMLIIFIFFGGTILLVNPVIKLLMIVLFVYSLVFYVMQTFVYLERNVDLTPGVKANQ